MLKNSKNFNLENYHTDLAQLPYTDLLDAYNENESVTVEIPVLEEIEITFSSCSQEIKHYFLKLLADGKEHSRKELVAALAASTRVNVFTDAMVINTLRCMANDRQIVNSMRGKYILAGTSYLSLTNQLLAVLKRNKLQLTALANVNYINMREEELEVLNKVKSCIITIDETIKELAETAVS